MSLAIVIPAYKDRFLHKTLSAFENQTNKNFTIYIGDDNSPHDLKSICDAFSRTLNLFYTRFHNNIGACNLVYQWKRCIELTQQEEWIWLFSDDDLVDTNCVESFYRQMEQDNGIRDIYRFNTIVVDSNEEITWRTPVSPFHESSEEMAYYLLQGKRGNSLADHIFSRKVFEKSGGLVYTQYAQGADWAMSILFSKKTGITVIPGACFYWRYSGMNISSTTGKVKDRMLQGHLQFISWVLSHFYYLKGQPTTISYQMICSAARMNLKNVLIHHFKGIPATGFVHLFRFMNMQMNLSYPEIISDLFQVMKYTSKTLIFTANTRNALVRNIKKLKRK